MTSSDQDISVHQIFGRNLRELCKRTGTIAEVADHLGVNRVQMNRILNGESFPKPGLMKRICDHFSVNARILLEPLAELEAEKRDQSPGDVRGLSGPFDYAFFGRDYSVNEGNVNREIVPLFHTYSKHCDWHRSFWHTNMADAWIFIWAVFGDEFGKPNR